MKFSALIAIALVVVAVGCNKKEEAAPAIQVVPVQGEVPPMNAEEGHNVEHQHVTEGADHSHDEAHHGDHDHAAHHPDHQQ